MDRRITGALIALVALATWLYSPVAKAPFVWQDIDSVRSAIVWELPGRGLSVWTWQLVGMHPGAGHLLNLALHLANGWLVFLVASLLASPLAAVCAAGVFILHTRNSESVAYVTGRADLLVTLWSLAAVWAAITYVDRGGWWRVAVSGLALVAAAMSKEIGLMAVPLVALTVAILRPACRPTPLVLQMLWGVLGLALGAAWWRISTWTVLLNGSPGMGWSTFASFQLAAVWDLLRSFVTLQGFSIDRDVIGLSPAFQLSAGLLTVPLLPLVIWTWRRAPVVAWSICWVAICVAPRFLFADMEFITEYKCSTAMVGLSVLIGHLAAAVCRELVPLIQEA